MELLRHVFRLRQVLRKAYLDALKDKESLWRGKARMSWLSDGNRSTSLFHRMARQRVVYGRIQFKMGIGTLRIWLS